MVRRKRRTQTTLTSLSIAEIQSLLEKKISQERKRLPALEKKRDKLASQLEELDSKIAAIRGSAPARRGRPGRRTRKGAGAIRAKRGGKTTIPAAIHQVLEAAGKPMKAIEIRDAILKKKLIKGVKKSFAAQVNIALGKHKEFKRKGRGVYSL